MYALVSVSYESGRPSRTRNPDQERASLIPGDDEVLVRVHAATVCAADYRLARIVRSVPGRTILGLRGKPVIMGMELAGTEECTPVRNLLRRETPLVGPGCVGSPLR